MQRTVAAAIAVALMLALVAGGCGSSSGPTKADFVQQADAVCTKARKQLRTGATNPAAFADKIVTFQSAKIHGVGVLTPPDELKNEYALYTKVMADRLANLKLFFAAAKAKRSTHHFESPAVQYRAKEEQLAQVLGLKACLEFDR